MAGLEQLMALRCKNLFSAVQELQNKLRDIRSQQRVKLNSATFTTETISS